MVKHAKVIFLVILFLVVSAFSSYFYFGDMWEVEKDVTEEGVKTEYIVGDLPPNLPSNLPLEEGAVLMRNEIVTVPPGNEVQSVRTYLSKESVADNTTIFRKYLKDNGWLIVIDQNNQDFGLLMAEKPDKKGTFKFSVSKNSITKDITVEVNMTIRN